MRLHRGFHSRYYMSLNTPVGLPGGQPRSLNDHQVALVAYEKTDDESEQLRANTPKRLKEHSCRRQIQ